LPFERWRVGYYFTGAKEKDLFFTDYFLLFFIGIGEPLR
jgi:hypothetical protein